MQRLRQKDDERRDDPLEQSQHRGQVSVNGTVKQKQKVEKKCDLNKAVTQR